MCWSTIFLHDNLICTKKQQGTKLVLCCNWRRRWDSNPRSCEAQLISSRWKPLPSCVLGWLLRAHRNAKSLDFMRVCGHKYPRQKASQKIAPKAGFLDKCEQAVSAHSWNKKSLFFYRRIFHLILGMLSAILILIDTTNYHKAVTK